MLHLASGVSLRIKLILPNSCQTTKIGKSLASNNDSRISPRLPQKPPNSIVAKLELASLYIYEIDLIIGEEFEHEFFSLKFNVTTFKYKIHSV